MHALELRDNALQWETERQNRILQNAAEQKKKQQRLETVQREQGAATSAEQAPAIQLNEWIDKVNAIPDIRSALIPLDDEDAWSKPFSLAKADMEPWLSYFKGYRQSRLFLHSSPQVADAADQAALEARVDYPVRALLELKRAGMRLVTEPPVQINGQVEYFDTEGALNSGLDSSQFRALLRGAVLTHDKQLKLAEEKGREMGDALYDALMGEGHANLIRAWEKVFERKPSVEELHQMLTSGRVKPVVEKKSVTNESRPAVSEAARSVPPARPNAEKRPSPPKELPVLAEPAAPEADGDDEPIVTLTSQKTQGGDKRPRKLFWTALHATIACAALAAYILWF
ncbi:MAG TPA: hypothetical protein VEC35_02605 [Noviherbaspirillum sp.]|nr:hypothetical protein [Noviherbaspirillum sp.]